MTDITLEQRADRLFDAMMAAPYGNACIGDVVCAETTASRLRAAWLPLIEAALRLSAGADWVLVPREPTEAMREAFKNIPLTLDDMLFQTRAWAGLEPGVRNVDDVATAADRRDFGKRYVAMLAAAPKPEDS